MIFFKKIVFYGLFIFNPWGIAFAQTPFDDKSWNTTTLKLEDNFNSFDANKWIKDFGWGNTVSGWKVIFKPEQVYTISITEPGGTVSNCLQLKAQIDNTDAVTPIHTGIITAKTQMLYGYFEIRCRIRNTGYQYNSAFWVWNSNNCNCSGPGCPGWYNEIDFFEALPRWSTTPGIFDKMTFQRNIYYKNTSCTPLDDQIAPDWDMSNVSNNFHVYGYEWTPKNIICYFDGVPYSYLNRDNLPNHALNLVAQLGFSDNGTTYTNADNYMSFPGYMDIDYIKVFDLEKTNYIDYNTTVFNPDTYTYTVKNSITIGGGISTIPSGKKATLRAANDAIINGEFNVNTGGELIILPTQTY